MPEMPLIAHAGVPSALVTAGKQRRRDHARYLGCQVRFQAATRPELRRRASFTPAELHHRRPAGFSFVNAAEFSPIGRWPPHPSGTAIAASSRAPSGPNRCAADCGHSVRRRNRFIGRAERTMHPWVSAAVMAMIHAAQIGKLFMVRSPLTLNKAIFGAG